MGWKKVNHFEVGPYELVKMEFHRENVLRLNSNTPSAIDINLGTLSLLRYSDVITKSPQSQTMESHMSQKLTIAPAVNEHPQQSYIDVLKSRVEEIDVAISKNSEERDTLVAQILELKEKLDAANEALRVCENEVPKLREERYHLTSILNRIDS